MKFNYALWQQLQNENRKSIGRNIASFSLLRWTGFFARGLRRTQIRTSREGNKEKRGECARSYLLDGERGAGATPNPPVIHPLSYFLTQKTQCTTRLIATFANNQETVMDSTCSPATLIIVVVWFHPALPFGGQRRDDGFARGVKLSRSDILSSVTLRESGSVGLAL